MQKLVSASVQDTLNFSRQIAKQLTGGDILLLTGELGTGKTTFVQGLARALGIREKITSPTFTIMHTHKVAKGVEHIAYSRERRAKHPKLYALSSKPYTLRWFVHADAYRLKKAEEAYGIGLMDWMGRKDAVVVVEWGEKIKKLVTQPAIMIHFRYSQQNQNRLITIRSLVV